VNEVWLSTFLQQLAFHGNRGTQQGFCFNKSSMRNCTILARIPNLWVWC